jgi:hypothetical protein
MFAKDRAGQPQAKADQQRVDEPSDKVDLSLVRPNDST